MHPFIPTTVGDVREYRWESPSGAGTIRMELASQRRSRDGFELHWTTHGEHSSEFLRSCDETGAEEPWLALSASPDGMHLPQQSWRVPADLPVGQTFGGTLTVSMLGLGVTIMRTHRVAARETIHALGREVSTLRIDVEERTEHASQPIASTQWIAEGLGLVRMRIGPDGQQSEVQLTSVE